MFYPANGQPAGGLYLTQFRAHDPRIGRWLSRDSAGEAMVLRSIEPSNLTGPLPPAAFAHRLTARRQIPLGDACNLYAFAADDLVNLIDPLGLCVDPQQYLSASAPPALALAARTDVALPGWGLPAGVALAAYVASLDSLTADPDTEQDWERVRQAANGQVPSPARLLPDPVPQQPVPYAPDTVNHFKFNPNSL
jgi:hypothetical protein